MWDRMRERMTGQYPFRYLRCRTIRWRLQDYQNRFVGIGSNDCFAAYLPHTGKWFKLQ